MDDRNRLVFVLSVGEQFLRDLLWAYSRTPVSRDDFSAQPKRGHHLAPERREPSGFKHENAVARRERIRERRFPSARAGGRINNHGRFSFEH